MDCLGPVDGTNVANQLRLAVYLIHSQGFSTIQGGCLGVLETNSIPEKKAGWKKTVPF